MKKKFAVIAGDRRMLNLALSLADLSYEVNIIGFENAGICDKIHCIDNIFDCVSSVDAVVLPVPLFDKEGELNAPFSREKIPFYDLLQCIDSRKTLVFTPQITDEMKKYKLNFVNYMEDEALLLNNAYLTAEGALSEIIRQTDFSLNGAKALVIGCGRVGRAVASALKKAGADVTVSARKTYDFAYITLEKMKAAHTEKLSKCIASFDFTVNTVPAPVLGEKQLSKIKPGAILFDLAPNTDGVDKAAAKELGVKYVPLGGIPGKFSSRTAGEVICKAVVRIAEEGK